MVEEARIWRTGDNVNIACGSRLVSGHVVLASPNGVSLMLGFGAVLDGHVGMMPVIRHDDGVYRSIATGVVVELSPATGGVDA